MPSAMASVYFSAKVRSDSCAVAIARSSSSSISGSNASAKRARFHEVIAGWLP